MVVLKAFSFSKTELNRVISALLLVGLRVIHFLFTFNQAFKFKFREAHAHSKSHSPIQYAHKTYPPEQTQIYTPKLAQKENDMYLIQIYSKII